MPGKMAAIQGAQVAGKSFRAVSKVLFAPDRQGKQPLLIVYGTEYGASRELAHRLFDELTDALPGASVRLMSMEHSEVLDLAAEWCAGDLQHAGRRSASAGGPKRSSSSSTPWPAPAPASPAFTTPCWLSATRCPWSLVTHFFALACFFFLSSFFSCLLLACFFILFCSSVVILVLSASQH